MEWAIGVPSQTVDCTTCARNDGSSSENLAAFPCAFLHADSSGRLYIICCNRPEGELSSRARECHDKELTWSVCVRGRLISQSNTHFTVWARTAPSISLWLYSTDAPIEQVPVHWENRHLLSFQSGCVLDVYRAWNREIYLERDSSDRNTWLQFRLVPLAETGKET
jgi:hypothetical protein